MQFVQDMTVGSPLKLLASFSLPMLVGNLFQQLYTMVDSIIVGKVLGTEALAAVGVCGPLIYFLFAVFQGLALGVGIIISQYFGAGDQKNVKRGIASSVYLIGISVLFLTVVGIFFAEPILEFLNTPKEILNDAVAYFQITSTGIFAVAFYNGLSSILRSLGDSKTPLIFLIISAALNIGLDFLFVPVLGMGVSGAAFATIVSQFVSACGCLIFARHTNLYFQLEKDDFHIQPRILKQMIYVGVPIAIQDSMISVSCIALQSVINSFGAGIVAVFTATNKIENMVVQIFASLHSALSSYTAQNMGAGNVERVRKGTRCCVRITVIFSFLMMIVMYVFGETFMSWFVTDAVIIQTGADALKLISLFFVAWGLLHVLRGILNGTGDARFAFFSGLLEIASRMGTAFLLTGIPMIGQWGIWLAEGITWILVTVTGMIRYGKGKWAREGQMLKKFHS